MTVGNADGSVGRKGDGGRQGAKKDNRQYQKEERMEEIEIDDKTSVEQRMSME